MMISKFCTFLLLLLGSALPALSDSCPEPGRLPPTCECSWQVVTEGVDVELDCSGSTIRQLRDALELMDKESRLGVHLDSMELGDDLHLPSDIFDGSNVVRLDISHCDLDALAPPGETPLKGLEEKLEELTVASSLIEEERPTVLPLAHLRRLRELDLSYNAITEVSDDWFSSPPPSLTHLILSNNGIQKIGDRAFENLVNLEILELHGNRFGPIKRSMLPRTANRLENLELDNNAFTSLPDDIFTNMPVLNHLTITNNGITHLQEKTFKPIWSQLEIFDARGNPLECDSLMEWLFHVKTEAGLIEGTCEGPLGREGVELKDFIENKGE